MNIAPSKSPNNTAFIRSSLAPPLEFGYVTMDAGIPNTSTKLTRDIAVLQPSDQKPNQHNINSDSAMSQLVHIGLICSKKIPKVRSFSAVSKAVP